MEQASDQVAFLMADDDSDDRVLAGRALQECNPSARMNFVQDGAELLDYLLRRGRYASPGCAPRPQVILLDLNMPGINGWQALAAIRGDAVLRRIPVVIMTTSHTEEEISRSYESGANAFIAKPVSFEKLVDAMRSLSVFWMQIVQLPRQNEGD